MKSNIIKKIKVGCVLIALAVMLGSHFVLTYLAITASQTADFANILWWNTIGEGWIELFGFIFALPMTIWLFWKVLKNMDILCGSEKCENKI